MIERPTALHARSPPSVSFPPPHTSEPVFVPPTSHHGTISAPTHTPRALQRQQCASPAARVDARSSCAV
ncbi:hypothetical protein EON67_05340 [archaeon]|nr:MAG: hypothetical protein EON67_05340 [archaeon]